MNDDTTDNTTDERSTAGDSGVDTSDASAPIERVTTASAPTRTGPNHSGPTDTAPIDSDDLRLLVQRLARRIRANRADDSISDAHLGALFALDKLGPLSPGELARHERVTPPSINRTINAVEQAGWVRRSDDPADGRRVVVSLTDQGRQLLATTRAMRSRWFSTHLDALSADERERLARAADVIRKLADS